MEMKMTRVLRNTTLLACSLMCSSCQSYYRVTDLQNNQTYYTKGCAWAMHRRNGAVEFDDLATGDDIVLQNSRLTKITQEEAQASIKKTDAVK